MTDILARLNGNGEPWTFAEIIAEMTRLRGEVTSLKGQHKGLVLQNALLRQRPDLPVDRIPAAREAETLRAEITRLRCEVEETGAEFARLSNDLAKSLLENEALRAEVARKDQALKEAADELDAYYRAEYPGDHPYNQKKLAAALAANPARAALTQQEVKDLPKADEALLYANLRKLYVDTQ